MEDTEEVRGSPAQPASMLGMEGETARPWGGYHTAAFLPHVGVLKILRVAPHSRLSLQRHEGRCEHWVLLRGQVTATVQGQQHDLRRGDHISISCGAWHRVCNTGDEDALVAEVQVGGYGDPAQAEADIERSEDDYGRV